MAEAPMNIYQKIAKVRKMVEVLQKDKSGFNYKYVSDAQILAKVTAGMEKYGLLLIPTIVPGTTKIEPYTYSKTKFAKNGDKYEDVNNEIIVSAEMVMQWINIDNPNEKISIPWTMVAQQSDAAQSFGSALSYSRRYSLIQFFSISTVENDVDAWRSEQKQAEQSEGVEISRGIIEQIDAIYARNAGDEAKKKKFIEELKKVVLIDGKPSVNYKMIKDPAMAAQALAVTKKVFEIKEEK